MVLTKCNGFLLLFGKRIFSPRFYNIVQWCFLVKIIIMFLIWINLKCYIKYYIGFFLEGKKYTLTISPYLRLYVILYMHTRTRSHSPHFTSFSFLIQNLLPYSRRTFVWVYLSFENVLSFVSYINILFLYYLISLYGPLIFINGGVGRC